MGSPAGPSNPTPPGGPGRDFADFEAGKQTPARFPGPEVGAAGVDVAAPAHTAARKGQPA